MLIQVADLEQDVSHRRHFVVSGESHVILTHDFAADGAVPGVGGDIDGHRRLLEAGKEVRQRIEMSAVLSDDECRHALADGGERIRMFVQLMPVMTVSVDETRRQHETARIDNGVRTGRFDIADSRDAILQDAYVNVLRGAAAAVDHPGVDDDRPGGSGHFL